MPFKPRFRRARLFFHRNARPVSDFSNKKGAIILIVLIIILGFSLHASSVFLKDIAGEIALSDATDIITATINDTIHEKMSEGQYDYNYFVTLHKDENQNITAISANMARINTLSSDILNDVIKSTNSGALDLKIPFGNLLGSNLLLGRGPNIPVEIIMLTSSYADFRNELSSAGINQTKHQIILEVRVQIDVLLPWEVRSTEVLSEVLIAETIIVGKVPDTYLSLK
ncbi:MAG: sporulation protein YunB [Oscillospiraceae bacterium]